MKVCNLLQSTSTIQGEISNQSVASKLVLLTLHFPNVLLLDVISIFSYCACHVTYVQLRLLWCSGSYATSEVFKALKVYMLLRVLIKIYLDRGASWSPYVKM